MRKFWTTVMIIALAAIGAAALVDVLRGSSAGRERFSDRESRPTPATTVPPRVCEPGQLALGLENLDGTNAVALRQVDGPPCQATDLTLRVYVRSHGRRSEIPLGDEAVLDGVYSASFERSVAFSICKAGSGLTAEAIAGPYRVSGPVQPGGLNCQGAIREVSVNFGRQPGTRHFRITPLDPVTHTVSFLVDVPRRTDIRVTAQAGAGPFLKVLDRRQRDDCRHIAGRDSCRIDYGLMGEGARAQWTVLVHKRSQGRAHVSFAISFMAANG